jgi:hypothetical protein
MIFTFLSSCLFGSSLLMLLPAIYLFFRIKSELSELEMRLLALSIELKASIKEQIKGSIDFHLRELDEKQVSQSLPKIVIK